jgi:transposase
VQVDRPAVGFDRLAGLVAERLGRPARSGALFGFRGKRGDAIKVLFFDGTGCACSTSASIAAPSAGPRRSSLA